MIQIYLDSLHRRRVINPMIAGGVVGGIFGCKNGKTFEKAVLTFQAYVQVYGG